MTAMKTCRTARAGGLGQLVEAAEDLDRLAAQGAIDRAPVGVGELAGAAVEVGVADLAVLGVALGLELLAQRVDVVLLATPAQRRADHEHDDEQHDQDDEVVHPGPS
jgi:hypothetical protein